MGRRGNRIMILTKEQRIARLKRFGFNPIHLFGNVYLAKRKVKSKIYTLTIISDKPLIF